MGVVSVIVPVYNVEKYLRRCVESIMAQTYTDLEIILVDDGAQDGSPLLCDQLATEDARIKVIHQKNVGLGYARNSGLQLVTGDYVTFVDSDDYIGRSHIEALHSALTKNNSDAVLGFYTSVNEKGEEVSKKSKLEIGVYERERLEKEILLPLIGTDEGCPYDTVVEASSCMNMYRMSLVKEHSIRFTSEREAVAEDQFFNIDFFAHANSVTVTDINDYFYYENQQSISRRYDEKRFARTVNYYHLLSQKAKQHGMTNLIGNRIERSFLMKTRVAIKHIVLSKLDFSSKKREICNILNHELTEQVLKAYPISPYPTGIKLLMILMRDKRIYAIYALFNMREQMRKAKILAKGLKRVGIGE